MKYKHLGFESKEIVVEDLSRLNAINDQSTLNLLVILDKDNIEAARSYRTLP